MTRAIISNTPTMVQIRFAPGICVLLSFCPVGLDRERVSCKIGHMSKATTMKDTDYLLSGYADLKAQTPWAHCPMTFDEWCAGAADTPESLLYWQGWNGGLNDVYAAAQRAA